MNTRTCRICKEKKPFTKFIKNKPSKYGRGTICYACRRPIILKEHDKYRFGGNKYEVLTRDKFACVSCGITQKEHYNKYGQGLAIDHIDMNGRNSDYKNHDMDNLQTLCVVCHGRRHRLIQIKK